jgi:hypothetical protein
MDNQALKALKYAQNGLFWDRLGPFDFPLQTSMSPNFNVIVRLLKSY